MADLRGKSPRQRLEEFVFALEIDIERAFGDIGRTGNVLHRGAAITILTEELKRSIENDAGLLALHLPAGRLCRCS